MADRDVLITGIGLVSSLGEGMPYSTGPSGVSKVWAAGSAAPRTATR